MQSDKDLERDLENPYYNGDEFAESPPRNRTATMSSVPPAYMDDDIEPLIRGDKKTPEGKDTAYDIDEDLPLKQAIKKYPRVVGYCLALTGAIVGWGFQTIIQGAVVSVTAFQQDFGEFYIDVKDENKEKWLIPAIWLSLWQAFGPLGSAIGSAAGGSLQDRKGRRLSMIVGCILAGISVLLLFVSNIPANSDARRAVFLIGSTIQGVAIGIIKVTSQTYVSENAPKCLRGSAMALFPTFTLLGQLLGAIVIFAINKIKSHKGYSGALGSQGLFAVLPLILAIYMPESPAYLVRKGKMNEALKSAQRLYAPNMDPMVAIEKAQANNNNSGETGDITYKRCFTKAHRRRTGIVILANLIPSLFGLPLLSNASYFVQQVGMAVSPSLLFMIFGIVLAMFANGAGIWLLSRISRRRLINYTLAITFVLWTVMGVTGFTRGAYLPWLTSAIMMLVITVCGLGCWPASYAVGGEASALRMRAKTGAVGGIAESALSIAFNFVLPLLYNPDAANLGAKTGFVFAAMTGLAVVSCWLWVPEMKDRSQGEIDTMFQLGLGAREFEKWNGKEMKMGYN